MPHVLHLIKDATSPTTLDVLTEQAKDPAVRVTVVLMQGASPSAVALPGEVYRLADGDPAEAVDPAHRRIGHAELLDLIFAADSVVTW